MPVVSPAWTSREATLRSYGDGVVRVARSAAK